MGRSSLSSTISMKRLLIHTTVTVLSACAPEPQTITVNLRKGMTQAQVEAAYGKPRQIQ